MPNMVPYLARHSGAPIDALNHLRPLEEIRKRGRWQSMTSVIRYEKGGRILERWQSLPKAFKDYAAACAKYLHGNFLGQNRFFPLPTLPVTGVWRTSSLGVAGSKRP